MSRDPFRNSEHHIFILLVFIVFILGLFVSCFGLVVSLLFVLLFCGGFIRREKDIRDGGYFFVHELPEDRSAFRVVASTSHELETNSIGLSLEFSVVGVSTDSLVKEVEGASDQIVLKRKGKSDQGQSSSSKKIKSSTDHHPHADSLAAMSHGDVGDLMGQDRGHKVGVVLGDVEDAREDKDVASGKDKGVDGGIVDEDEFPFSTFQEGLVVSVAWIFRRRSCSLSLLKVLLQSVVKLLEEVDADEHEEVVSGIFVWEDSASKGLVLGLCFFFTCFEFVGVIEEDEAVSSSEGRLVDGHDEDREQKTGDKEEEELGLLLVVGEDFPSPQKRQRHDEPS